MLNNSMYFIQSASKIQPDFLKITLTIRIENSRKINEQSTKNIATFFESPILPN